MYNPKDIIDLIADNVNKTGNPFGIPKFIVNNWWKHNNVPQEGGAMLFTGLMYQFLPYIEKSTHYLAQFEDTPRADYIRYGKYIPKYLAGLGLAALTPAREKRKFNAIIRNIAKLLTKSNVDFCYKPHLDDYSGVLLYDLGDQEGFVRHAGNVAKKLKRSGINRLITVDPHTTYALKVLFPEYTGEQFDVKTYFELINFQSTNGTRRVTLHDPCFYGRYLQLSDVPVRLLADLNIECTAVRNSGPFTACCGGPAESISPKLSADIADRRLKELETDGTPIIAMCPICLGNLKKAGANVLDLSTLILQCAP